GIEDRLAAAHLEPVDVAEVDGLGEPQERLPGTGKIPEPREWGGRRWRAVLSLGSSRCRIHVRLCYRQGEYSPCRPKWGFPKSQALENRPNRVRRLFVGACGAMV